MPGRARRILIGIGWVWGSLAAWAGICNAFVFGWLYLQDERSVRIPGWVSDAYDWTSVAGIVLIPPVVALLAMRAKLPGTGPTARGGRGFPMENGEPARPAAGDGNQ